MNISYNWLKRYIALNDSAEQVAHILTSIGLEVGKVEKVQTIKGGLEGTIAGASNGSGFSGTVASAVRGGASGAVSGGRRGFEGGMDFNAGTHLRDKQFK